MTQAQGKAVATKMGALYMECSSKEMTGVHDIFDTALEIVIRSQDAENGAEVPMSKDGQVLPVRKKKSRSCKIL